MVNTLTLAVRGSLVLLTPAGLVLMTVQLRSADLTYQLVNSTMSKIRPFGLAISAPVTGNPIPATCSVEKKQRDMWAEIDEALTPWGEQGLHGVGVGADFVFAGSARPSN